MPGEDHADGGAVDVGLGFRPDLTGRAPGLGFMLAGLEFARRRFAPDGFRPTEVFTHGTNDDEHPFC